MLDVNNSQKAMLVMLRGLGFSQTEIAEQLGLSQSTVHKYQWKIKQSAVVRGNEIVFLEMLLHGPIDSDSILAYGNRKFELSQGRDLRARKQDDSLEWA